VRQWHGRHDGPGGQTVFLTNAAVPPPLHACDADEARRLMENSCLKAGQQPGALGHPPQQTDRAVRGPVVCPLRMFALATADRLPCAPDATGGEAVGWQRWRRQRWEPTRALVIVGAHGDDGLLQLAASSRLVGGKLTDVPPGIGTRPDLLATYQLTRRGSPLCWNLS
jgi:hypothetical protein